MEKKYELLAPAGDMERLKAAIDFGADVVYFAGKKYGLRAFSANFERDEMKEAIDYAHAHNVKCYITVNILAHEGDFDGLVDYLKYLEDCHADAVIVSDMGIASLVKEHTNLELHISTQANITNSYTANVWVKLGAQRLILARELSLGEIKSIRDNVPKDIDIECFVHGAMCISYSGRCLLSNFFTGRDSNKGACAQVCRWEYELVYKDSNGNQYPVKEDNKGTYIFNSKDMCLVNHLKELLDAGITSFKIEGRMKTPYYVATVVNAYRRAFNDLENNVDPSFNYVEELEKTSHRRFTTGFYFGSEDKEYIESSQPVQSCVFTGVVVEDSKDGYVKIEMRNRFKLGDILEVLSPDDNFNKTIEVKDIIDSKGMHIVDAIKVQEVVSVPTSLNLKAGNIVRMRKE